MLVSHENLNTSANISDNLKQGYMIRKYDSLLIR